MTNKEMSELFSVMMLAWPNAEMFKGGVAKLAPTIKLWTSCLPEIDFWTGQQALIKLCRVCKYPPTIAEFKSRLTSSTKRSRAPFSKYRPTSGTLTILADRWKRGTQSFHPVARKNWS